MGHKRIRMRHMHACDLRPGGIFLASVYELPKHAEPPNATESLYLYTKYDIQNVGCASAHSNSHKRQHSALSKLPSSIMRHL